MNTHRSNRTAWIWSGALLSILLLASCGVTDPDESPWQDVRSFSWPTTTGTLMKYRTEALDNDGKLVVTNSELKVEQGADVDSDVTYNGQPMSLLNDTDADNQNPGAALHFLPMQDTLIVKNDEISAEVALVAPIKKGHRWVATYNGQDTSIVAEIIELFSYRKVEGITYKNVVAVKYKDLRTLPNQSFDTEWVRFFAEGVGEIETIQNDYPVSSSSSAPLPQKRKSTVLVETSFSAN